SAQTFTLGRGFVGHRVSCRVTGINPAGSATAISRAIAVTFRPGGPKMKVAKSVRASRQGVGAIKGTGPRGFTLCVGQLSVKTRGRHPARIGAGSFSLHGARSASIRVRLSTATFKLLQRKHSLACTASATAHDASGRVGTVTSKLTLLAPTGQQRRH